MTLEPVGTHRVRRAAGRRLRSHVRTVWKSRGGGFYGFVAAGTFLYLEVTDLVGDVPALLAVGLDLGGMISFFVNNLVEAVTFTVKAALWPVWWIEHAGIGIGSAALLGVGYLAFRAIRPTVSRWLEDSEADRPGE